MFTPAQQKAFATALAVCQEEDERIKVLEEIAKHSPAIAQQVSELRTMCNQIRNQAEVGVAVAATAKPKAKSKGG